MRARENQLFTRNSARENMARVCDRISDAATSAAMLISERPAGRPMRCAALRGQAPAQSELEQLLFARIRRL